MARKEKAPKQKGARTWKLYGRVASIGAGLAAAQATNVVWTAATGKRPPNNPESPDVAGKEAVIWAALSGAIMQSARLLATRKAAAYWVRSTGQLPPGLTDEGAKELRKDLSRKEKGGSEPTRPRR